MCPHRYQAYSVDSRQYTHDKRGNFTESFLLACWLFCWHDSDTCVRYFAPLITCIKAKLPRLPIVTHQSSMSKYREKIPPDESVSPSKADDAGKLPELQSMSSCHSHTMSQWPSSDDDTKPHIRERRVRLVVGRWWQTMTSAASCRASHD